MSDQKARIAIFASGNGTNAEAIMRFFSINAAAEVVLVLSNNSEAYVLQRAKNFHIATNVFAREQFRESDEVIEWLRDAEVTHIVLAGFLWLVPPSLIKAFPERIVNIHPSLLPKFSGKGMYGMRVHSAVKSAGDLETGITIHVVTEQYDEGEILFQTKCSLDSNDSPEKIAEKVHALEYEHYPEVIERWIAGR